MKKIAENKDKTKEKKLRKEFIIYFIVEIILIMICVWDRVVNIPKFPKCLLYLTQIDLYINMIYYLLRLYYNFQNIESKGHYQLFFNFNFCISFVVFIMYWPMFFFDRKTLYRNDKEITVPTLLNLLLHGGVFINNLFELLFTFKKRKNYSYINIWFYFCFTILYVGILYIIKIIFNIKVYPFIYGSLIKFIVISLLGFISCLIGHYLYIFLTKKQKQKSKEKDYEQFEMN